MATTLLPPPSWLVGPPTGPQHPAPTGTMIADRVHAAVNLACELRVPGRYRIGVGVVLIATYRTVVLPNHNPFDPGDPDEAEIFTVEIESNARQLARFDVDHHDGGPARHPDTVAATLLHLARTRTDAMRKTLRYWNDA